MDGVVPSPNQESFTSILHLVEGLPGIEKLESDGNEVIKAHPSPLVQEYS
jgi:hypothetical protein